ncbi:MAG TPA: dihydropteroate synthase [Bacteroidales bacterium]|nr:dihydropteroate synthase [Bacteroidales bacterium]
MFGTPRYINAAGRLIDLSVPKVMGILNVTPDSFYSGSRHSTDEDIINTAVKMVQEGADIIDVGGYSSRPGAGDVSKEDEGRRVFRAIKLILKEIPGAIISVDTFRAEVAAEAIEGCGAHIINDISGSEADEKMFELVTRLNVPYILMHMRGTPATMKDFSDYDDIVADLLKWFGTKIYDLRAAGVKDIILDPGFGFAKTIDQNFEILRRLKEFSVAELPLLAGLSRKSSVWKTLGISPDEALNGTTALNAVALMNGADIIRVHDVKEAVECVKLAMKLRKTEFF